MLRETARLRDVCAEAPAPNPQVDRLREVLTRDGAPLRGAQQAASVEECLSRHERRSVGWGSFGCDML